MKSKMSFYAIMALLAMLFLCAMQVRWWVNQHSLYQTYREKIEIQASSPTSQSKEETKPQLTNWRNQYNHNTWLRNHPGLFFIIIYGVLIVAAVICAKAIIGFTRLAISFYRGNVFTDNNARLLYKIGMLLFWGSIVHIFSNAWLVWYTPNYPLTIVSLIPTIALQELIAGFVMLLMGEAFRIGLGLKVEQELTI